MPHLCTARGHVERGRPPGGLRKIVIALDTETFEQVRARAIGAGHSFAAETRLLIEWGLEADNAA
jgi:hypothetical protein